MGKQELGLKCTCVSCAARFYDLRRLPAICPKCGASQPAPKERVFAAPRAASRRWPRMPPTFPGAAPAEAEAAEVVAVEEEEADVVDDPDAVEADAVDDDDDDVGPVVPEHDV